MANCATKTTTKKCNRPCPRRQKYKPDLTPDEKYHECLKKMKKLLGSGLSDNIQRVITIPHEDSDVTKKALKSDQDKLRLIAVWKGCRENDKQQYDYDAQFSNFLSFLYLIKNDYENAREEYANLSKTNPGACKSIMSLLNKSQYRKGSGECKEAVVVLKEIITILRDQNQSSEAKQLYGAELANLYRQLGSSYYQKAVLLYADVLQKVMSGKLNQNTLNVTIHSVFDKKSLHDIWSSYPTETCESPMKKKLILWAFQAASIMIKLLEKSHLHVLHKLVPHNSELDLEIYFKNILNLLDFVIMTEDEVFAGRAKAETGLAYSMYELIGHRNDRTHMRAVPVNYVDQCMNQAKEMSPENPNVLWLVGRYLRQRASNLVDLKRAADVLQKCVDICPSLHMALHHLALAHRAMWLIQGNFPEAKLVVNQVRTTRSSNQGNFPEATGSSNQVQNQPSSNQRKKKRKQKSQRQREQRERQMKTYEELKRGPGPMNSLTEDDSACPSTSQEQASESSHDPVPCTTHNEPLNPTAKKVLSTTKIFPGDLELTTERATWKRQASAPPSFSKVSPVLAKYPVDGRKCPKHYKKPDYYDTLRTNNPEGSEDDVNLRKARDLLELANEITSESSPRYLIDLARVLISMKGVRSRNEPDPTIISLLKKTGDVIEERSSDYSNDAAYLYEQWGLLLMKASKLDDAKLMFRKSLKYSVQAKLRSKVAFYRLCDILNKQTEKTTDTGRRASLTKEHALIKKMIEQYGHAGDLIVKELKQHAKEEHFIMYALQRIAHGQQLVWELIDAFYKENNVESAFTYLCIVTQFYGLSDLCDEEKVKEVREVASNIAVKAVINGGGAGFQNVFRWIFRADSKPDPNDDNVDVDDSESDGDKNESSPEPDDAESETTQNVGGIGDSLDSIAISEEVSCIDMCQCGVESKESCENCNLSTSDSSVLMDTEEDDDDVFGDLDIVIMTPDEKDEEINEIVKALSGSFGLKVILVTNDGIPELCEPGADDIDHFDILDKNLHAVRTMFIDTDAFSKESGSETLKFAFNNMVKNLPFFCMGFSRSGQSTCTVDQFGLRTFPKVLIDSSLNHVNKAAQLIRKLSEEGSGDIADKD